MKLAVIGAGGIGSTFAYQLARAGHEVTVVARPGSSRLQQLQRDRAIVHKNGERADVHVAEVLDEHVVYDLVVVTTLAHQADAVLPALRRSQARCVQFMFNTFEAERLRDALGPDRCSFGMPFVMARITSNGTLDSTIHRGRKTLHGDVRWVELFGGSGIPSAFEPHMMLWLRCHVPMCISMESIAVAGLRRGRGASWRESMVVARGMRAAFAVIKRSERLYPRAKSIVSASPTFLLALMLWSLSRVTSFREVLATGVNECRALVDAVAADADPAQAIAIRAIKPTA